MAVPGSLFERSFQGDFIEGQTRTLQLDRSPHTFRVIFDYLSGYDVFPIDEEECRPSGLSRIKFLAYLHQDADYYGLTTLAAQASAARARLAMDLHNAQRREPALDEARRSHETALQTSKQAHELVMEKYRQEHSLKELRAAHKYQKELASAKVEHDLQVAARRYLLELSRPYMESLFNCRNEGRKVWSWKSRRITALKELCLTDAKSRGFQRFAHADGADTGPRCGRPPHSSQNFGRKGG